MKIGTGVEEFLCVCERELFFFLFFLHWILVLYHLQGIENTLLLLYMKLMFLEHVVYALYVVDSE